MQAIPRSGYKQQPKRIPRSLGFARYALDFDRDNYADCGSDASLKPAGMATMQFWINPRSYATIPKRQIMGFPLRQGYTFWQWPRCWVVELNPIGGTRRHIDLPLDFIPLNTWTCATLVFDAVNGRLMAHKNHILHTERHISIGDIVYAGTFRVGHGLDGSILIVLVYNKALSADERDWNILNYHNPIRDGLVLWLPMEEGAGEVVYDKSGYGNNGTLLPAGGLGPTWERLRQWELRAAVE